MRLSQRKHHAASNLLRPAELDAADCCSFRDVLRRAKDATTKAFANVDVPFAKVVEALGVPRSAAFTPVYQVIHTASDSTIWHCVSIVVCSIVHSRLSSCILVLL